MPIWRGKAAVPSVGPDIHVKYKFDLFSGLSDSKKASYSEATAKAMSEARTMLSLILTEMGKNYASLNDEVKEYLHYYFVLGDSPPSSRDYQIIFQTLQLIYTSLMGTDISIKVPVSTPTTDYRGYVRLHAHSKWTSPKSSWVASTGSRHYVGDIHLATSIFDGGRSSEAPRTLIHEASHRYAGTSDFGEKGYVDRAGYFRSSGLTHAEALNNAESYSSFVYRSVKWGGLS